MASYTWPCTHICIYRTAFTAAIRNLKSQILKMFSRRRRCKAMSFGGEADATYGRVGALATITTPRKAEACVPCVCTATRLAKSMDLSSAIVVVEYAMAQHRLPPQRRTVMAPKRIRRERTICKMSFFLKKSQKKQYEQQLTPRRRFD